MLIDELPNPLNQIWNAFWSGGVLNPLSVLKQITYLLFIKRLGDLEKMEESKALAHGEPMGKRIFPKGHDPQGRPGNLKSGSPRTSTTLSPSTASGFSGYIRV